MIRSADVQITITNANGAMTSMSVEEDLDDTSSQSSSVQTSDGREVINSIGIIAEMGAYDYVELDS